MFAVGDICPSTLSTTGTQMHTEHSNLLNFQLFWSINQTPAHARNNINVHRTQHNKSTECTRNITHKTHAYFVHGDAMHMLGAHVIVWDNITNLASLPSVGHDSHSMPDPHSSCAAKWNYKCPPGVPACLFYNAHDKRSLIYAECIFRLMYNSIYAVICERIWIYVPHTHSACQTNCGKLLTIDNNCCDTLLKSSGSIMRGEFINLSNLNWIRMGLYANGLKLSMSTFSCDAYASERENFIANSWFGNHLHCE